MGMQQDSDNRIDVIDKEEALPDAQLDDMFGRLDKAIEQQGPMARLASLQTSLRSALVLFISILVLGGTYVMTARPELSMLLSGAPFLGTVLFAASAMLLMTTLALRPYHRPTLRSSTAAIALAVGLLAVIALALVPTVSVNHVAAHGLGSGMTCLAMGSVVGGLLFLALVLLDRGQPFGLLLSGAAAALLGNLMLQLHCADDGIGHRLFGHAGIYVLYLTTLTAMWVRQASQHTRPLP